MPSNELVQKTASALHQIQAFDPDSLARQNELGETGNFLPAVEPARNIVDLYRKIRPENLELFSDNQLSTLYQCITTTRDSIFAPILTANTLTIQNRTSYIENVPAHLNYLIDSLSTIISYSMLHEISSVSLRETYQDSINQLQNHCLAVINNIKPRTDSIEEKLKIFESRVYEQDTYFANFMTSINRSHENIANLEGTYNRLIESAQQAFMQKGIADQASHFNIQAHKNEISATTWLITSIVLGLITIAFAFFSAVSYKISFFMPHNSLETAQLISGKLFILGMLGYGLITCVKNFMGQTHNGIINRHRQNSIMSYQSFLGASPNLATREIVLTYVAASVFAPQETGYVKNEEQIGGKSIFEMVTKGTFGGGKGDQ